MRRFPEPATDTLSSFAYHSTRIERVPIRPDDIDLTLSGQKVHPFLAGQFSAINLVLMRAYDPDLIPNDEPPTWRQTLNQISFLPDIHRNLFTPIAEHGLLTLDEALLKPNQVGEYRDERKWLVGREMPNPVSIPHHLHDWWTDLIRFHNIYRHKIETPGLLEQADIKTLSEKAYESNLKLCCIKPFIDGSNRTARLIENLLRLNWGLPWKIIKHEDEFKLPYIDDIIKMQEQFPA